MEEWSKEWKSEQVTYKKGIIWKGLITLDIQTGPFAACQADFVSKFIFHPLLIQNKISGGMKEWMKFRKGSSLKGDNMKKF